MKTNLGIAPAIVGILAIAFAVPVVAQPRQAVPYADLDLTRPEAAATLDQRLVRAARRVCMAESRALADVMKAQQCRQNALAEARAEAARLQATMVAGRPQANTGS